jgi:hypothetical protein
MTLDPVPFALTWREWAGWSGLPGDAIAECR